MEWAPFSVPVFPEATGVVVPPAVAPREVRNAVAGVAAASRVAGPGVVAGTASAADAAVFQASADIASAAGAAGLQASADIVSAAGPGVGAACIVFVAAGAAVFQASAGIVSAAGPGVVFVAPASVADVAEPPASADTAPASDVSVPVSAAAVEADSSGRPMSHVFPNAWYYASSSSPYGVAGPGCVRSPSDVRASRGPCNIFSTPDPRRSKNWGHSYSKPSPGHNNMSDTSDRPTDATTSRSRKTGPHLSQEQHIHRPYQAKLSLREAPQM